MKPRSCQTANGADDSDTEHHRLLAACRAGNIDEAAEFLEAHLAEAEHALVGFLHDRDNPQGADD